MSSSLASRVKGFELSIAFIVRHYAPLFWTKFWFETNKPVVVTSSESWWKVIQFSNSPNSPSNFTLTDSNKDFEYF